MEASWAAGDDYRLPMGRVDDALDTSGLQQASLDAAIPSSNRGFQMLQRMGWSQGKGLGAAEDGEAHRSPPAPVQCLHACTSYSCGSNALARPAFHFM